MNISDKDRAFEYEIDLSRFALESMGTYVVTRHVLGGRTVLNENNPGKLSAKDRLGAGKLFMIEFNPKR